MRKEDVLKKLKQGNEHFVHDKLEGKKHDSLRRGELTKRSDILAIAVVSGKLLIVPEYYHLDTGSVDFLN